MTLAEGRLLAVAEPTDELKYPLRPIAHGKVVAAEITDAAVRAQQMLAEAEAQIAEKLSQFEAAQEATRSSMLQQAREEAECQLAAKFIEVSTLRQREVEKSRENVIQLARLLAERILRHELSAHPTSLIRLAEQCIAETSGSSSVLIRANPEDIRVIREPLEALTNGRVSLELLPDPELVRGDLHVESDIGTLDARLGTQLANLAEVLRDSLRP